MVAYRDIARRCEDLGYSCLYVGDHFLDQFGPLVAMTIAAEATTRLRVGSLVLANDYRHPVVLAKEIATLALAAPGRLEFGLGAGWLISDYEAAGIRMDPPAVRVERMLEGLTVMRSLWNEEVVTFSGKYYTVTKAPGLPRPGPVPHIVIGGGSRRILSIAATEADIVGINPNRRSGGPGPEMSAQLLPAKWDERVDWVKGAAGDRLDSLELQVQTAVVRVGAGREEALDEAAQRFGLPADDLARIPIVIVGSVDEICEQLQQRRERWGFSYIKVPAREMQAFSPVVARLAGT